RLPFWQTKKRQAAEAPVRARAGASLLHLHKFDMQNGVAFCGSPIKGWNKEWQSSVAETTRPANLPRLPSRARGEYPTERPGLSGNPGFFLFGTPRESLASQYARSLSRHYTDGERHSGRETDIYS